MQNNNAVKFEWNSIEFQFYNKLLKKCCELFSRANCQRERQRHRQKERDQKQ